MLIKCANFVTWMNECIMIEWYYFMFYLEFWIYSQHKWLLIPVNVIIIHWPDRNCVMVFSAMKILLMNLMIILRDVRSIEMWTNVIIITIIIVHIQKSICNLKKDMQCILNDFLSKFVNLSDCNYKKNYLIVHLHVRICF